MPAIFVWEKSIHHNIAHCNTLAPCHRNSKFVHGTIGPRVDVVVTEIFATCIHLLQLQYKICSHNTRVSRKSANYTKKTHDTLIYYYFNCSTARAHFSICVVYFLLNFFFDQNPHWVFESSSSCGSDKFHHGDMEKNDCDLAWRTCSFWYNSNLLYLLINKNKINVGRALLHASACPRTTQASGKQQDQISSNAR